jgi:undecaprenyl-diphosphatase
VTKVISTKKTVQNNSKLVLAFCLAFLATFILVLFFRSSFAQVDSEVNLWIPSIQSSVLTDGAIAVSFAFGSYSLLAATVAISAFLFIKNYCGESILLLGAMGGVTVLVAALKNLVHSTRPLNGLISNSGFSFPSGHTAGTIVFCGLIAYFAWQKWKTPKPRALAATFFVAISSVVGFDRIYLNVHWFSDVLGAAMLGLFLLTSSIFLLKQMRNLRKVA